LTDALEAYHGTLCFITHDRTLIRQIANKIIEIRNGVPIVYAGNYDEYLAWKEKTAKGEEVDFRSRTDDSSREPSLREIQRRRKAAEGELRNSYYRDVSPIRKRISQIEENLPTLESEFRDLESYFSSPENYGNGAEITAATKRYQELKRMVSRLTDEWAELSMEAERLKVDFDESMKHLESDFARLE
jgi:ATP-binding cassette subfamily F protein 3